jgi:hypothetical protein
MALSFGIGDVLSVTSLDEIRRLVSAHEMVCRDLCIFSSSDPRAEVVALKIVEVARTGERDPGRLRDLAMLDLATILRSPHSNNSPALREVAGSASSSRVKNG